MEQMTRNKQQEVAMGIIYQCLFLDNMNLTYDIKQIISDTCEMPFDDVDLFIRRVVVSAMAHKEEIQEIITSHLRNWKYDRLSKVEVAILFLAYSHYKFVGDVDRTIVINVAVNQAKKYLDIKDYKFVNAILENIL